VMESEFARVSVMGPHPAYYAGLMASILLEAGEVGRALALLDAILESVKEPGVGFYVPEIHRLRAECLLRADPANFDEAVRGWEAAIATARQPQARTFESRAAIGLSRAWATKGAPEKGVAALREIVGVFTADDSPPELATAQEMLAGAPDYGLG